jgi:Sec-independent protein translocase protein TatA
MIGHLGPSEWLVVGGLAVLILAVNRLAIRWASAKRSEKSHCPNGGLEAPARRAR